MLLKKRGGVIGGGTPAICRAKQSQRLETSISHLYPNCLVSKDTGKGSSLHSALKPLKWHISSHESGPISVCPVPTASLTINLISPEASISEFGVRESCLGPRSLFPFSVARPSWTAFRKPGLLHLFKWDNSGLSDMFPTMTVSLLGRSQLGTSYFSGRKYNKAFRWSWKNKNRKSCVSLCLW